jgi:hypothetical protein
VCVQCARQRATMVQQPYSQYTTSGTGWAGSPSAQGHQKSAGALDRRTGHQWVQKGVESRTIFQNNRLPGPAGRLPGLVSNPRLPHCLPSAAVTSSLSTIIDHTCRRHSFIAPFTFFYVTVRHHSISTAAPVSSQSHAYTRHTEG